MPSSSAMQKSSLAAVDVPAGLLPIIDFAALLSDRTEDRKTAAQAIRTACRDKGFSPPRSRWRGLWAGFPQRPTLIVRTRRAVWVCVN
jgi:hypothetical protein